MGSSNYSDELLQNLKLFRRDDFLCDTVITIGEKSLRAHGVVLAAASPFFQAILRLNTEPGLHLINLSGCEFDVIEAAVQFIYTGRLEVAVKYADSEKLVQLLDSLSDLGLNQDQLRGCELVFKSEEESNITKSEPQEILDVMKEVVAEDNVIDTEAPTEEKFNQDLDLNSRNNRADDGSGQLRLTKSTGKQLKEGDVAREHLEASELGLETSRWVFKNEQGLSFLVGLDDVSDNLSPLEQKVSIKMEADSEGASVNNVDSNLLCKKVRSKRGKNSVDRRAMTAKDRSRVKQNVFAEMVQSGGDDISETVATLDADLPAISDHKKHDDLVCQTCGKVFGRNEHLNIHLRIHTGEKPYACDVCGKSFSLSSNLKRHLHSHTGEKRFLCDLCGRGFTQRTTLNDHMAVHTKERKHMCNLCGKFLKNPGCLRAHSKRHKLGFIRKKCEGIGHIDVSEEGWKLYQDMEPVIKDNGIARFVCKICQKDYASKNYLAVHMQYHADTKPYPCKFCERAFWRSSHLKMHERSHTGERPFCCTTCGKSFTYAAVLNTHMRLHTGEKPFKCEFCGSSYTQQAHLKAHVRTHTGEKPYSCQACGKQYRNKVDLRFHFKRNPSCKEISE